MITSAGLLTCGSSREPGLPGVSAPVACAGFARRLQLRGQSRVCTAFPFHRTVEPPGPKHTLGSAARGESARPEATCRGPFPKMPQATCAGWARCGLLAARERGGVRWPITDWDDPMPNSAHIPGAERFLIRLARRTAALRGGTPPEVLSLRARRAACAGVVSTRNRGAGSDREWCTAATWYALFARRVRLSRPRGRWRGAGRGRWRYHLAPRARIAAITAEIARRSAVPRGGGGADPS